jgi:hypothetical protein
VRGWGREGLESWDTKNKTFTFRYIYMGEL